MKTWSRILGWLAAILSVAVVVKGVNDYSGSVDASLRVRSSESDASLARGDVENEQLDVRTKELGVDIARRQGKGIKEAEFELSIAEAKLHAAEMQQNSPINSMLRDRYAADVAMYTGALDLDEHLAYVTVALWLCFGFAVALSKRA